MYVWESRVHKRPEENEGSKSQLLCLLLTALAFYTKEFTTA